MVQGERRNSKFRIFLLCHLEPTFLGVYFDSCLGCRGLPWWLRWYRIHVQCRRPGFDPWVGKIPWRRIWLPTPIFLPGESPWTEESGRLQSMGLQRLEPDVLET